MVPKTNQTKDCIVIEKKKLNCAANHISLDYLKSFFKDLGIFSYYDVVVSSNVVNPSFPNMGSESH